MSPTANPRPIERRSRQRRLEQIEMLKEVLLGQVGKCFTLAEAAALVGRKKDGLFRVDLDQVRKQVRRETDMLITNCEHESGTDRFVFWVLSPHEESGHAIGPLKSMSAQVRARVSNTHEAANWTAEYAVNGNHRLFAKVTARATKSFMLVFDEFDALSRDLDQIVQDASSPSAA